MDEQIEIWKPINDFPQYMISNVGRVKSLNYKRMNIEKLLTPTLAKNGYLMVDLKNKGLRKNTYVHKLIAQAFIPNPDNKSYVDHINANRTDNRVENLRWVTHKENMNNPNAIDKHRKICIGNSYHNKCVLQFTENDEFVKQWDSATLAIKSMGLKTNFTGISLCCKGKRHTANGYKWGYADDYERILFKVFDLEIYKKIA